jgi:hypothetical protein
LIDSLIDGLIQHHQGNGNSREALHGTILHDVFERSIQRRVFDLPALHEMLSDIVNDKIEDMYVLWN